MNPQILDDLRDHLALCREVLALVEQEGQSLRSSSSSSLFGLYQTKRVLLPRLEASLQRIRRHRLEWQRLNPTERQCHPEVSTLIRQNQNLMMRAILLDRENEQNLLRRGLVPARELPSANRQRPHYVADLYRRRSGLS
jgi:flagellar biosynthesis/type III secretory pathway chaperone